MARTESRPFVAMIGSMPVAAAAASQHGRNDIALARKRFLVGNHDGPLHPRREIASIEAQPNLEIPGFFADADVRLGDDCSVELAPRQQAEDVRITWSESNDGYILLGIEAL